jgi:hypothetical protein
LALAALDGQLVNAGPFVLSKLVHVAMAVLLLLLLLLFKNDLDLTFGRILRALKKNPAAISDHFSFCFCCCCLSNSHKRHDMGEFAYSLNHIIQHPVAAI